jgi:hypothetical protein
MSAGVESLESLYVMYVCVGSVSFRFSSFPTHLPRNHHPSMLFDLHAKLFALLSYSRWWRSSLYTIFAPISDHLSLLLFFLHPMFTISVASAFIRIEELPVQSMGCAIECSVTRVDPYHQS